MTSDAALTKIFRNLCDGFERDFAAGDAEGLVSSFYGPDALFSPPFEGMSSDHASITAAFRKMIAGFTECRLYQEVLRTGAGDRAFEVSRAVLKGRDGAPDAEARYAVVWRDYPGIGWRCECDLWTVGKLFDAD